MKPLPHEYEVKLTGTPSGYATVSASGMPDLMSAPPADFGGPGDAWSPEHFLMAAVETCLLFSLRAIARASKLEFSSLEVTGVGTVDRQAGVTRFTEIVLRPKLVIPAETDKERALRILDKAERSCLVSASISTPIRMEAEIAFG
jgi:peroxiredoxin-like protein